MEMLGRNVITRHENGSCEAVGLLLATRSLRLAVLAVQDEMSKFVSGVEADPFACLADVEEDEGTAPAMGGEGVDRRAFRGE
jgi:hypothetical protein